MLTENGNRYGRFLSGAEKLQFMDEGKILKRYAGISEAQHFYIFPLPQGQGALRDIFL